MGLGRVRGEGQRPYLAKARQAVRAEVVGGQHPVGPRPEEDHVVLADPEGSEFCRIGPDNAFLAGDRGAGRPLNPPAT
ncbi:hypothetical protein Sme01_07380 [Sphaerisporangium melleum]|uniref:Uncharacterized protein n=1 Tax=Sphaerisporangium melleum TaxID=321316 RepID=A0A917VGH1_9ACTN|nr:hypothetical protein [Sphaerisporangium melleum]GGK73030.1 hypothetical protein GCM10007964_14820 [Sphaerisporangium melleum]GII68262.1 hypothetical protein Sme01_07380 [Sphaerisporangium melleum]